MRLIFILRSLWRWSWQEAEGREHEGSWALATDEDLQLSEEKSARIARMSHMTDGRELARLWTQANILRGNRAPTAGFSLDEWDNYRFHFVAVISGQLAQRYWRCPTCSLSLCTCLPFALAGLKSAPQQSLGSRMLSKFRSRKRYGKQF